MEDEYLKTVSATEYRHITHGLGYLRIVKTTPKMIHCSDGSKYRRETGEHVGGRGKAHPYDVKHAEALI